MVAVNKVGTDDAGYNPVGAPWSRLTIAAALADLATNYPAASSTFFHVIAIGPGTYDTPAFALPPWTFLCGSCDGQGQPNTVINLTGNITLGAGWAANTTARGGLGQLIIRPAAGSPVIDFTLPVPVSGNPSRTAQVFGLKHDIDFTFAATGTADALSIDGMVQDGSLADTITITGGNVSINQLNTIADVALISGATIPLSAVLLCCQIPVIAVTKGVAACAVSFDGVSWPLRASVTLTGGPTLTRLSDANAEGYSPLVPGNWPVVPVTVQEALDYLAAGGAVVPANGYAAANNVAGNATITPTAHNYFLKLTVGGVARTSVEILSIATPPIAGDRIAVGCTFPATAAIIIEFRNAVVGGTLIYSFVTDGATLSGLFEFVYNGAAWEAAGYQVPYQN